MAPQYKYSLKDWVWTTKKGVGGGRRAKRREGVERRKNG